MNIRYCKNLKYNYKNNFVHSTYLTKDKDTGKKSNKIKVEINPNKNPLLFLIKFIK